MCNFPFINMKYQQYLDYVNVNQPKLDNVKSYILNIVRVFVNILYTRISQ